MSGIIGIFNQDNNDTNIEDLIFGMYALQHRGQDTMGIVLYDDDNIEKKYGPGTVADNISLDDVDKLRANVSIGHMKYEFLGEKATENMPYFYNGGSVAIDGVITNEDFSLQELVEKIQGSEEELTEYISGLKGAFAMVYADKDKLMAIRDSHSVKPISVGVKDKEFIVASETCAFDSVGAEKYKDLIGGEIFIVTKNKIQSIYSKQREHRLAIFEMLYIQRPDSYVEGVSVYKSRFNAGEILYDECKTDADIVIGSPESGSIAALGYAKKANIECLPGLVKNRYIKRTFIEKEDSTRRNSVKVKLNAVKEIIQGKDVILVDDSIVRGTTIRRVVETLKNAGAKKIHVRIASPEIRTSDSITIDIPDERKLIAYRRTLEEMREEIGCDSLYFLSLNGLRNACGNKGYYERYFWGESHE
ncbi:MAG: amidophosphoribosyltransferase [Peptoniphilaceae bacterium]|nr:amidophosphoribosyltransferase [Peptoniphilaceae bacterium]MDY3738628.1 amidophosphoribosyltransferase [Peptoniphilaceae bacterium]